MRKIISVVLLFAFSFLAKADEGMWLPFLLQQLNSQELYIKGLKIPVEEIYSADKKSLKDAVVLFGGGCTGEMISYEGLLLTNHHCGYSTIQSHSSVEKNYLKDGFWAMNKSEEIPSPGLTATFIVKMEDVSSQIIPSLSESMTEDERNAKVNERIAEIEKKAVEGNHYKAQVKAFFEGNTYILILSEVFKDVRMVGAPPTSIGNFGGETDNWMWPRHTGDFALFRIYAGKDNKPAEYDPSNVPFKPRHAFPISLQGVKENDFTMVYGFPGKTMQYITSHAVDITINVSDPNRIAIRDKKINIMQSFMKADEKVFIQYASKEKSLANAYKKWKGEIAGLLQLDAIQKKKDLETDFKIWSSANDDRKKTYGGLIEKFDGVYNDYKKYVTATDYYAEAGLGSEIVYYANHFRKLAALSSEKDADNDKVKQEAERLLKGSDNWFKNYHQPLDRQLTERMMEEYIKHVDPSLQPDLLKDENAKNNGELSLYIDKVFSKSMFVSREKTQDFLKNYSSSKVKKLVNDPGYVLAAAIIDAYNEKVNPVANQKKNELAQLSRIYMNGLREMKEGRKFYPDANSTLRLAYGTVSGYDPRDGVDYDFYTTLDGIIEKSLTGNEDYVIPEKLKALYKAKDYGIYAVGGTVPVAFIASNHTTGGNSGSPALNAQGELIGTNFDRVWEGTMSDIMYSPDRCRNIMVDIRYTLFIIDKFAGATHLINEMELIRPVSP